MEAICKIDYDQRVEASTKAAKEKERRKKRPMKRHAQKGVLRKKGILV